MRKEYPFLKAVKPKADGLDTYHNELKDLGVSGLLQILDQGRKWADVLAAHLSSGGGAIFPHTYVSKCGYQIAAVIQGILECGAKRVILLGTAHAFPGELMESRIKELNEEDISKESSWGILDPNSEKGYLTKLEFSLDIFKALWQIEVARRGITPPTVIELYPCLTNRQPKNLPGWNALNELSKNAVVVGTEDYCHHGIAYGVAKEEALPMNESGLGFARHHIEKGFSILQRGDYAAYFEHCLNPKALSDPPDVTSVIHAIVGKKTMPKILDLKLVDVSPLFEGEPSPSWVAATLVIV